MDATFQSAVDLGRSLIPKKCQDSSHQQVESLLDAEVALLRKLRFEQCFLQYLECAEKLRQRNLPFHAIGSGCSSILLYLLGISEVDPIHHETHFQRFWQTSSKEPPVLQLVVDGMNTGVSDGLAAPPSVSIHEMTFLEKLSSQLELQLGKLKTRKLDQKTLAVLQTGDTNGIFQLESERSRWLLSQVQPIDLEELACVTALEQLSYTRPDVVINYLEIHREILVARHVAGCKVSLEVRHRLPLLFQEQIMWLLRRLGKVPWEETYGFVQTAAKRQMDDQNVLWKNALAAMKVAYPEEHEAMLGCFAKSCEWALCFAHHVANALTSYKAAYFRTHHRWEFESLRKQLYSSQEQLA